MKIQKRIPRTILIEILKRFSRRILRRSQKECWARLTLSKIQQDVLKRIPKTLLMQEIFRGSDERLQERMAPSIFYRIHPIKVHYTGNEYLRNQRDCPAVFILLR